MPKLLLTHTCSRLPGEGGKSQLHLDPADQGKCLQRPCKCGSEPCLVVFQWWPGLGGGERAPLVWADLGWALLLPGNSSMGITCGDLGLSWASLEPLAGAVAEGPVAWRNKKHAFVGRALAAQSRLAVQACIWGSLVTCSALRQGGHGVPRWGLGGTLPRGPLPQDQLHMPAHSCEWHLSWPISHPSQASILNLKLTSKSSFPLARAAKVPGAACSPVFQTDATGLSLPQFPSGRL